MVLGNSDFDDVLPWPGGDYSIDQTVLGEKAIQEGAKRVILFACGCGYSMCSAVYADVVVQGDTITIGNIDVAWGTKQSIASLPPIIFDRNQFEEAVAQLKREIAAWCPPPPDEAAQ